MHIGTIYKKELIDVLRDRKTLIFMLLIPALAMPVLIAGGSKLVIHLQKKQSVEVVRVAATEDSQAAYRDLLFDWFNGGRVGKSMRLATSPIMRALVKPEHRKGLDAIPKEIFTDSVAFGNWVKDMAQKARSDVQQQDFDDIAEEDSDGKGFERTEEAMEAGMDFYNVLLKGYGLIEFVDTGTLKAAPDEMLLAELDKELSEIPDVAVAAAAIKAREIHGYLYVPEDVVGLREDSERKAELLLLHDSTIRLSNEADGRFKDVSRELRESIVAARLELHSLPKSFLKPLRMARLADVASDSEKLFYVIGSILPYIIIAFAFLGGMYPAIDLGAGEKERGTLETLVLSPATRTEIALGKFFVILTSALTAAFLGVTSIAVSFHSIVPDALMEELDFDLPISTIIPVALLTIPPAAAFAGLFLAISIYARSFKEAQSYIAPLQFILILPAMAPMLPGFEMSWKIAAIPLVNVSMISKELLKGDANWGYYAMTFGSCLTAAGICIAFAIAQFRREEVLFRS